MNSPTREEYILQQQTRINGYEQQIDAMRQEMDSHDADAKTNFQTALPGLEQRLNDLKRQLAEVEAASDNEWHDLQARVDETGGEVLDAFEALKNDVEPPAVAMHRTENK
ncbi:hypothetical protein KQI52_06550 [bacterium]|nr:hypothetical protein [bacterium]